jgi:hypothetical protein
MMRVASIRKSRAPELVDFGQITLPVLPMTEKVLRFVQAGISNPPRLFRINRNLPLRSFLAVNGEALIHGPHLVAWSVGSERRNLRLLQEVNQSITI